MKNYYEILGVASNANSNEIRDAFRKLSKKLHPDKNLDDPVFNEMFKSINEAYSILGNSEERRKYDNSLNHNTGHHSKHNTVFFEFDEKFFDVVALIIATNKSSTSMLQIKFKIGFNRACRIVDQLESIGIISYPIAGSQHIVKVNQSQAIGMLEKNLQNFSSSHFKSRIEYYRKELQPVKSKKTKVKNFSPWEKVRKWRRVKNTLWLINLLLIVGIILKPRLNLDSILPIIPTRSGVVVSKSGLNLREEPSNEAKVITTISYNEHVKILKSANIESFEKRVNDGWIHVNYEGTKGWVWGEYVLVSKN